MFKLAKDNVVWWRINLPERNADGDVIEVPVRFRVRIFTRTEMQDRRIAMMRDGAHKLGEAMSRLTSAKTVEQVEEANKLIGDTIDDIIKDDDAKTAELTARLLGWNSEDVTDAESGAPVAFSAELLEQLLSDSARYDALWDGLVEASRGAARKNSLPGRGGQPVPSQAGVENGSGTSTESSAT